MNYILNRLTPPRDPSESKIFSAAEVKSNSKKLGYIYVILGSNEYRTVSEMLFSSHVSTLAIKAFIFIIVLSIIFSLFYINRMKRRFNHVINVLGRFEQGELSARFKTKQDDELAPVSHAFNKMAHLLTQNISKPTQSEKERKDFMANISHDLRTPLSIARGYLETMLIKKNENSITQQEGESYMLMILKPNFISG